MARLTKGWAMSGMAVLLLVAAAYVAVHILSSPAEGRVRNPAASSTIKPAMPVSYGQISDQYLRFTYPDYFHLNKDDTADGGASIEHFILTSSHGGSGLLAITLAHLPPSGSLADESSYHLRQIEPATYSKQTITLASGEQAIIMADKTQYQKTAYLLHGSLYATIALTSSVPDAAVADHDFMSVLNSWRWQ